MIAIASAAIGGIQARKNARAQNQFNQQRFEDTKVLAEGNLRDNQTALLRRQIEGREIRGEEALEVSREALSALGAARVSSSGAAGSAVTEMLTDLAAQEQRFKTSSTRQQQFEDGQFVIEQRAIIRQFQGQLLGATVPKITEPGALQIGLNIAGAGFGASAQSGGGGSDKITPNSTFGGSI